MNDNYTIAALLSGLGTISQKKNSSLYAIHSNEVLQHFSSVCSEFSNRRRRESNFSGVAETRKLLANSSYGYQIRDGSRHTKTKYLSDGKTHGAINNKKCNRQGYINDQLYEVELVKSEIDNKEPISVGFSPAKCKI